MDQEIEGTWEEIMSHAEELAGHRVGWKASSHHVRTVEKTGWGKFLFLKMSRRTGYYFGKALEKHHGTQEQA